MAAVKFYKGIGEVFDNLSNLDEGTLYFIDHDTHTSETEETLDISDIHPDSIWVGDSMVGSRYIEDLETRNGSTVSMHNLSCDGSITGLLIPTGDINMGSHAITNLYNPSNSLDAANKNYVDGQIRDSVLYTIYQSISSESDLPVNRLKANIKEQFAYIQLVVDTVGDKHEILGVNDRESIFNLGMSGEMIRNTSIRVYVYAKPVIECWWEDGYGVGTPVMIPGGSSDNTYPRTADDYIVDGKRMDVLSILPDFDGGGKYDDPLDSVNDDSNTFIAGKPTHLKPNYDHNGANEWMSNGIKLCLDHSTGRIGVGVLDIVYSMTSDNTYRTLVIPVSGFTEVTNS